MTQLSYIQISQLRRNAKRLAREQDVTYAQALDDQAKHQGYGNWSQLMKNGMRKARDVVPAPTARYTPDELKQLMGLPRMEATRDEQKLIMGIITRYAEILRGVKDVDPLSSMMDVEACHCNGCPIDLVGLAGARDVDLVHDVAGISRYLVRQTGKLAGVFTPRYALQQQLPQPSSQSLADA